jgi:hypothetical protein
MKSRKALPNQPRPTGPWTGGDPQRRDPPQCASYLQRYRHAGSDATTRAHVDPACLNPIRIGLRVSPAGT